MTYWEKRIIDDEAKAQKIASQYIQQEERYYRKIFKEIERYIDGIYSKLDKGELITRSELWSYEHYKNLRQAIYKSCGQLGLDQVSITEQTLDKVVEQVLGVNWKDNSASGILNRIKTKQYLNENWSGQNYSSRIWQNTNKLAATLEKSISDLVCLGKSPDQVKAAIMNDLNVSYNTANRLIRTEVSYTFNSANKERYQEMGAKQIEIFIEDDACEECQNLKGVYDFDVVPIVPIHPNCRCCYLPVVGQN